MVEEGVAAAVADAFLFLVVVGVAFEDAILMAVEALPIVWVDEEDHELHTVEVCRWEGLREQLLDSWADVETPPRAPPKATQQALATVERVRMYIYFYMFGVCLMILKQ